MSLSSHLRSPTSPVRAFFDLRLPHSQRVVAAGRRQVCQGGAVAPLAPAAGTDRTLVGTALEIALAAWLRKRRRLPPFAGDRETVTAYREAAEIAMAELRAGIREGRAVHAARWALVLARFEQRYRSGDDRIPDPARGASQGPHGVLAAARVPEGAVEDLAAVVAATIADHQDVYRAPQLTLGPTFALSRALGGADGDLVVCGLLLDVKTSSKPTVVDRRVLLQLLGYALADVDDTHDIHSVGVSAVRWRTWATWPLDWLLVELSAETQPVAAWREEFRAVVAALPSRRVRLPGYPRSTARSR